MGHYEIEFLTARARARGTAKANALLAPLDLKVHSYAVLSLAWSNMKRTRDRRSKVIKGTAKGRRVLAEAAVATQQAKDQAMAGLTAAERDQLRDLLPRVAFQAPGCGGQHEAVLHGNASAIWQSGRHLPGVLG